MNPLERRLAKLEGKRGHRQTAYTLMGPAELTDGELWKRCYPGLREPPTDAPILIVRLQGMCSER